MRWLAPLLLVLAIACNRETPEARQSAPPVTTTTTAPASAPPPAPPTVPGPKLAFVDEATRDPLLVAYRNELLAAVHARDAKALAALVDPHIRMSFGDANGPRELERMLAEGNLWEELEQVLTLGGTFREGMFWAPYVYSAFPDTYDAFTTLVIVGDDVPLREKPQRDAPAVATLSRNIVERVSEEKGWSRIKTADGRTGWVEARFVRSPVGYRAGFIKTAKGWRMNAMVAGD